MTSQDIREAVRKCLTACLSADSPLDVMAIHISYLRSIGWAQKDVHTVELIVVKVLSRMIEWPEEMIDDLSDRSGSNHLGQS